MPLTEAPPPETTGAEEENPRRARRGRASRLGVYDDLGGYDLLHVIEDLEDERARAQKREKIWIALILHLLLFAWIYWAPKYIWHVKVREAPMTQKQDMTVLTMPPSLLKQLQAEKPTPLSDRTRRQPSPKPTPRHVAPPAPVPVPKAQPQPKIVPPQVAHQTAPPAPKPRVATPPIAPSQNAQLNAPKPQPNFSTPQQTPGQAVEQAERDARSGTDDGGMGANVPPPHPGNNMTPDILSDTLGVNFGPYIQRVIYDTKRSWYPIIPEIARPPISKQGRVLIRFKIFPDGSVKGMTLEGPSGTTSLDHAAWGGILGANPFPPLPKNFKGPFLELRFYFIYNDGGGQ